MRSDDWISGYRCAWKDCVTWLHARAEEMNDPHAQTILNSAAFCLGNEGRVRAHQFNGGRGTGSGYEVTEAGRAQISKD